jgi:UDP-N-acetylglucosamine--N-acetylmuramyl-(pentapeptide) pyrophosphoryl-undecaprenol N-acetylglucosamine transferase
VLVFGGSQGAHAINTAMAAAADELAASVPGLQVTHQTGPRDADVVRDAYRRAGIDARVEPFLYEMHQEMHAADVVVCRSGATTLAELAAAGKAAILIPLPTATDDHQRANAAAMAAAGAAVLLDQREAGSSRLAREIASLCADRPARERMGRAAAALARPDAAAEIAARIIDLAGARV